MAGSDALARPAPSACGPRAHEASAEGDSSAEKTTIANTAFMLVTVAMANANEMFSDQALELGQKSKWLKYSIRLKCED